MMETLINITFGIMLITISTFGIYLTCSTVLLIMQKIREYKAKKSDRKDQSK